MTIGLLSESPDDRIWLFGGRFESIVPIEPGSMVLPRIEAALVQADAKAAEIPFAGIRWYQQLRRKHRSLIPVVLFGVEYIERLCSEFSIMSPDVPGGSYLELPVSPEQVASALEQLRPLTPSELQYVIRGHCGLQEEWHRVAHTFANLLHDWPVRRTKAVVLLRDWTGAIHDFAPDQTANLRRLEFALNGGVEEMRSAIQALEDGLSFIPGRSDLVEGAPFANPPSGYRVVAIADDQGYVPSTIQRLKQLGYEFADPALNREQALALIEYWRPQVVIADLNFPSTDDGLAVINAALADPGVQLVLGISRSRIEQGTLPAGVEDCSGALDFQDAERIHRMIWRRASARGVIEHA